MEDIKLECKKIEKMKTMQKYSQAKHDNNVIKKQSVFLKPKDYLTRYQNSVKGSKYLNNVNRECA